jgi:phosphoglycerol geranylgeranyltransferase
MATGKIYQGFSLLKKQHKSAFAVLADPDKIAPNDMQHLASLCNDAGVDFLFLGGSLLMVQQVEACLLKFKANSNIPVILFPGSPIQFTPLADAILYLSLVSGRNPDLLIGQHVISAPLIRNSGIEVISTAYMLIDGGVPTTVSYMSNSLPIPSNKPDIALSTAWAAELQGKHIIYMDAGSGAKRPVSSQMIEKVSRNTELPLIIGGGIQNAEQVYQNCLSGAQIVVVGNAIEKDPFLIKDLAAATKASYSNV